MNIEIPDWVVEAAAKAFFEDQCPLDHWDAPMEGDEREDWRDGARKVLRAALEGWLEPMQIEWAHIREEKVYLPGNSLVAASRHAANLPPPKAEYRHIWQAKLMASTKNDELPPQDLYRVTLRKDKTP